jgi:hypothetical protein
MAIGKEVGDLISAFEKLSYVLSKGIATRRGVQSIDSMAHMIDPGTSL